MSVSEAVAAQPGAAPSPKRQGGSYWGDIFRRLRGNPAAWIGAIVVAVFVLVAVLAPWIAPYPELASPGREHIRPTYLPGVGEVEGFPLGIDRFGGDVLSKLIWGARSSLVIGIVSTILGLLGGILLGAIAGAFGGWVDSIIMRFIDILMSVPNLLLAVSIAAILGRTPMAVMIAIGVAQVPIFARLLRSTMLQQREAEYVLAARTLGLGTGRIAVNHLLPNSMGPVIVQGTLTLATAVIEAAALSFLGLGGGRPETPEWGRMLTAAQAELAVAPTLAFLPGLCIMITAFGFTLLGEAMREAMDPRTRKR